MKKEKKKNNSGSFCRIYEISFRKVRKTKGSSTQHKKWLSNEIHSLLLVFATEPPMKMLLVVRHKPYERNRQRRRKWKEDEKGRKYGNGIASNWELIFQYRKGRRETEQLLQNRRLHFSLVLQRKKFLLCGMYVAVLSRCGRSRI